MKNTKLPNFVTPHFTHNKRSTSLVIARITNDEFRIEEVTLKLNITKELTMKNEFGSKIIQHKLQK